MLEHTFIHLPHIGARTEVSLWREGILTWNDLELHLKEWPKSIDRRNRIARELHQSSEKRGDAAYFYKKLPTRERWRLYRDFRECCGFLDIETTGMTLDRHEITVIGIYDGENTHHFINGKNLHKFEDAIEAYDLLVTFNGARFDLPFITSFFLNFHFHQAHIDLLHVVRRLGYRGGLKTIEPLFGICRKDDIHEMSGYEAVVLWHEYRQGDPNALQRLLLYNEADVVNLKTILEIACERLHRELEFATGRLLPF
jgi:uncharacterized protein YprB with RNaseH-like and TPR domain